MTTQPPRKEFATLTHARLRAQQGDVAGATRLLSAILAVEPDHLEARSLLLRLERIESTRRVDPEPLHSPPPESAGAADLASGFRVSMGVATPADAASTALKLRAWLDAVAQRRGARGVR